MVLRKLSMLLATCAISMFGEVPATAKAGSAAPSLTWTKIVASSSSSPGPQNLFGQTAVLLFLPPVSHNEQAILIWNKLVDQFADKPVNFVWIADEPEELLAPFLKTHPVHGWVVLDPEKKSYKSYGIEGGDGVLIDSQGVIAGFTFGIPDGGQIQAVLDGRAVAIKGEPAEAQLDAFFEGKAVRLEAEPSRIDRRPIEKPKLPPSDEVRISPSKTDGTISSSGPDHWMRRGFELRAVLSEILDTSPNRIQIPAALDKGARYDFVLVPPREEAEETINGQVLQGIEKYFQIAIATEIQSVDVYVMSALEGKTPPRKSESEAMGGSVGGVSVSVEVPEALRPTEDAPLTRKAAEEASRNALDSPEFREAMAMTQLIGASAFSSSVDEFCRSLEDGLHRPVLNETGLKGYYDFKTTGQARTTEEFLGMLRNQLGLVLTPAQRGVEMTVVRRVE